MRGPPMSPSPFFPAPAENKARGWLSGTAERHVSLSHSHSLSLLYSLSVSLSFFLFLSPSAGRSLGGLCFLFIPHLRHGNIEFWKRGEEKRASNSSVFCLGFHRVPYLFIINIFLTVVCFFDRSRNFMRGYSSSPRARRCSRRSSFPHRIHGGVSRVKARACSSLLQKLGFREDSWHLDRRGAARRKIWSCWLR